MSTHKAVGEGDEEMEEQVDEKEMPFLYLTVDVPAAPLFKDALERNIIPQAHMCPRQYTSPHANTHGPTPTRMPCPSLSSCCSVYRSPASLQKEAL